MTGLVIEAIQNSVSGDMGRFAATSAKPVVSRWRTLSFETTTVTAPAISFFPIISCIAVPIPGSVGSGAEAETAAESATMTARRMDVHGRRMYPLCRVAVKCDSRGSRVRGSGWQSTHRARGAQRPPAVHDFADDVPPGDVAPVPAVGAVVAAIAHDEVVSPAGRPRAPKSSWLRFSGATYWSSTGWSSRKTLPVHDRHLVALFRDHALDELPVGD